MTSINRTSLQLYRDCMRLVQHVAGKSPKGMALRHTVRSEFRKHTNEADPAKIEVLKSAAIRALSNYLVFESSEKDVKIKRNLAETAKINELAAKEPVKK